MAIAAQRVDLPAENLPLSLTILIAMVMDMTSIATGG
jgi:hypothetical protein